MQNEYEISKVVWALQQQVHTYLGNGRPGQVIMEIQRQNDRMDRIEKKYTWIIFILVGTLFLDGRISDMDKLLSIVLK